MKLLLGVVGRELEPLELLRESIELLGLFPGFKRFIKLLKNTFGVGVLGKLEDSFVCLGKPSVDLVGPLSVFALRPSLLWTGDLLLRYCSEIFRVAVFGGRFCSIFTVSAGSDLLINSSS